MTAIRQTMVFAIEDEYGQDTSTSMSNAPGEKWYSAPPGSFFSSSHTSQASPIYEVGRKKWDDVNYGKVNGTWEWTFPLDYNHLEPLLVAFDQYVYSDLTSDSNETVYVNWGRHKFTKEESKTPKSFTIRRKRLYRILGADHDEQTVLIGCICTSFRMSQASGKSQIIVSMSGIYSDERMDSDSDIELDPVEHTPVLVEFSCLNENDVPWYNVMTWQLQIQNNITGVYGAGYRCVRSIYEDQTNNGFSMTLYAENPKQLAQRVYNGGYDASESGPCRAEHGQQVVSGMPIPKLVLKSKSNIIESFFTNNTLSEEESLRYKMDITIVGCVVNSTTWENGNGSMLTDKLSNGRCQDISIEFINMFPCSYVQKNLDGLETIWAGHLTE